MSEARVGWTPPPRPHPYPSNLQYVPLLDGQLTAVARLEVIITQGPLSRRLRPLGLSFWFLVWVTEEKGKSWGVRRQPGSLTVLGL